MILKWQTRSKKLWPSLGIGWAYTTWRIRNASSITGHSGSEKKYVTGNCYVELAKASRGEGTSNIPLYDLYAPSHGFCDKFKKSRSRCIDSYKRGGKSCPGYTGKISDFYFTCALKNTFAVYQELLPEELTDLIFSNIYLICKSIF